MYGNAIALYFALSDIHLHWNGDLMLVVFGGYVTGYFVATARSTAGTNILERACRTMCDIFWITRMS